MPRAPLAQLMLALAFAAMVVYGVKAIDIHKESIRAAEMAKAERQAQAWLKSLPVREAAK